MAEFGRELYTAPFIWINWENLNVEEKNGKKKIKDMFCVEKIVIKDKKITCLSIKTTKGKRVFVYAENGGKNE